MSSLNVAGKYDIFEKPDQYKKLWAIAMSERAS